MPGEELAKVAYGLTDPEQYDGAKVLVVGGGDAALEAAIQLAGQSTAEVTLSYRGAELARCREANRKQIAALAASGRDHDAPALAGAGDPAGRGRRSTSAAASPRSRTTSSS